MRKCRTWRCRTKYPKTSDYCPTCGGHKDHFDSIETPALFFGLFVIGLVMISSGLVIIWIRTNILGMN